MLTILPYLSGFFFLMAIPASVWPHRFAPCAYGWNRSRKLAAALWFSMGGICFGLFGLLLLHGVEGWSTRVTIMAVVNFSAIALALRTFRKVQKPLYVGRADQLYHEFKIEKGQLSEEEQLKKVKAVYRAMLAELDAAEKYLENTRPNGWEEQLKKLRETKRGIEENSERLEKGLPPKSENFTPNS